MPGSHVGIPFGSCFFGLILVAVGAIKIQPLIGIPPIKLMHVRIVHRWNEPELGIGIPLGSQTLGVIFFGKRAVQVVLRHLEDGLTNTSYTSVGEGKEEEDRWPRFLLNQ